MSGNTLDWKTSGDCDCGTNVGVIDATQVTDTGGNKVYVVELMFKPNPKNTYSEFDYFIDMMTPSEAHDPSAKGRATPRWRPPHFRHRVDATLNWHHGTRVPP